MTMPAEKPTLVAFWGDTRKVLSYAERMDSLMEAKLESITPTEVLARVPGSHRLIVITAVTEDEIFCDVCDHDRIHHTYGNACPNFATCVADNPVSPRPGLPEVRVPPNGDPHKG